MLNKLSGKYGKILFGIAAVTTISTSGINLLANENDKVEMKQNRNNDQAPKSRRLNIFSVEVEKVEREQNRNNDTKLFDRTFLNNYVKDNNKEASDTNKDIIKTNEDENKTENGTNSSEVHYKVGDADAIAPEKIVIEDKHSASVHSELIAALRKSGVDEYKIVYNIQDLYPMAAGEDFVALHWTKLTQNNPHINTFMITKSQKTAVQYAEFNQITGEIKLITKSHNKGQEIVIDRNGTVSRDTGLYNIDRIR